MEYSYVVINNIPFEYHSKDLRKFFSDFVESGGFDCFHFLHRPERKRRLKPGEQQPVKPPAKTRCGIARLANGQVARFMRDYHGQRWHKSNGAGGAPSHLKCFIGRIQVSETADSEEGGTADQPSTSAEPEPSSAALPDVGAAVSAGDLVSMPEFKPPSVMPRGNVGTPTEHFLNLINSCKLPPKVVEKLGLDFSVVANKIKRPYSKVPPPVDDWWEEELEEDSSPTMEQKNEDDFIEARHLPAPDNDDAPHELDDDECEEWERHEAFKEDPGKQERHGERLYEENMEVVWEKGGPGLVFYTDAYYWGEQEEQDEKWADDWDVDMGVYYGDGKDADMEAKQLQRMRENDRLQKPGQSTSVFREKSSERRTRKRHYSNGDDVENPESVGTFERHTKGIGRKLLERQGWKAGAGIGGRPEFTGRPYPVSVDLESSALIGFYNKTGFGYTGPAMQRFGLRKYKDPDNPRLITTKFDEKDDHDADAIAGDRSRPLAAMKHRNPLQPEQRVCNSSCSTMSDYESDGGNFADNNVPVDERRQHHNALERKRRDHIKDSFDALKDVIPGMENDMKASRSSILKSAAEFIQQSRGQIANNQKDIEELERQNIELQRQIAQFEERAASARLLAPKPFPPPTNGVAPVSPLSDTDSSASGVPEP